MPKRGDIVEHRWNHRYPIDVRLSLLVPGTGVLPARTRDISLGGVSVNVHGPAAVLRRNIPVNLIVHLRERESLVRHSPRALVVRVHEESAGLMFMEMDPETFRVVSGLLGATRIWAPVPAPVRNDWRAARLRR